jgi:hypothetical protein
MSSETFEQTFPVTEPARLKLSNIRGSVVIQVGEPGIISVHATRHNDNSQQTTIGMSQAEDGTVVVETREPEGGWRFLNFSSPAKVDYQVSVPSVCSVNVSCVSSSLSVTGVSGEFSLRTVSGNMHLQQLTGTFKIHAVSGNVTGTGLSGESKLETVSGDINLSESDLPSMRGSTVSGDLFLHTALGSGPYKLSSVSGDVHFVVPADTACTAEVHAVSGSLITTLPHTSQSRHRGSSTAQIQGGGVVVKLNSVSGDLWIGQPGDEPGKAGAKAVSYSEPPEPPEHPEPPQPPEPPEPPVSQPKRLSTAEILAMVERGEMSVDEAIRSMQG